MSSLIPCQRDLFDIPGGVTYLNCAYMSPMMRSVAEEGRIGLDRKMHPWKIRSADFFSQSEELRARAARFFLSSGDDIAIIPSVSYGIQMAAANLPLAPGKKILVLEEQFPSNLYPWQRLAGQNGGAPLTVALPADGDWTSAVLRSMQREDIGIAALPQVHWTTGGLLDLARIGAACRELGIALALDLTQSLGVYPFDVNAVQPDFAVAAAYKWLMGPYSLGVTYIAPKWQQGLPLEESWLQRANARDFSSLTQYTDARAMGARRFDMGEHSNFATMPAAIAALRQLEAWGVPEISETVGALNRRLIGKLEPLGIQIWPEHLRAPHYLCLRSDRLPTAGMVETLAAEGIYVSARASSIRITPHVYNSVEEVERVGDRLIELAEKVEQRSHA